MYGIDRKSRTSAAGCGCCGDLSQPGSLMSRRSMLWTGIAAAAALASAQGAAAQSALTPDAALKALVDGNKGYVDKHLASFDEDLTILRQNTAEQQQPFAAVLSCADSRVPVEIAFDQTIGHVFVNRIAGNLATSEMIASLEYGAAVLGTRAILVLGHADCGALKAAIDAKEVPGQISQLYAPLRPAIDAARGDLNAAIRENAKIQAHLLATASPVLAGLIKNGKLKIAAGYYDLASGVVSLLS
jgi:carbonic anhydrase